MTPLHNFQRWNLLTYGYTDYSRAYRHHNDKLEIANTIINYYFKLIWLVMSKSNLRIGFQVAK